MRLSECDCCILICIRNIFIRTQTLFLSKHKEQANTKSRLNDLHHNDRRVFFKNLDRINSQTSNFIISAGQSNWEVFWFGWVVGRFKVATCGCGKLNGWVLELNFAAQIINSKSLS